MWLALTETNGKPVVVDMTKVAQVSHSVAGANLFFTFEVTSKSNEKRQKSLKVKETVSQIKLALAAKPVK
ncbi:hypothetical protein [Brucella pseudogrignonensis]|uniref:hypothetical protein n=1 Tax=Brucella pseudogrignonensis TaxID=419475 RepID=UPI003ECC444F